MSNLKLLDGSPRILIVTSRDDYTADYVVTRLRSLQLPFMRFNTEDFPSRATGAISYDSQGGSRPTTSLCVKSQEIRFDDLLGIWYRRPATPDLSVYDLDLADRYWASKECDAFLRALWETVDVNIVSVPSHIRRAEYKPLQLKMAQEHGLQIPETVITNDPVHIPSSEMKDWIMKPVWSGVCNSKSQESGIFCENASSWIPQALSVEIQCSPLIFQRMVPKICDARITFFGDQCFGFTVRPTNPGDLQLDWRRSAGDEITFTPYDPPLEIQSRCVALLSALGLKFGAFDFALTSDQRHIFLEVNPNGQWAWLEIVTGIDMTSALINLLRNGDGTW